MALSPFKLPNLISDVTIADSSGRPTLEFQRWWQSVVQKIESQEMLQSDLIAQLQSQQQQISQAVTDIQVAQATANAATGGNSGSDTDPNITVSSTVTWTPGPTVSLTGVAAGNLTIPGSGPLQDADVTLFISNVAQYVMQGQYRVVEIIGGVDGAVFGPWNFEVSYPEPPATTGSYSATVLNTDSSAVGAFSAALTTTGAIEYRLDFRRVSGPSVSNLRGYLFARRS